MTKAGDGEAAWPTPRPAWEAGTSAEERAFLDVCLTQLPPNYRVLLYLSFYGQLAVAQVDRALRPRRRQPRPERIVRRLVRAWRRVLAGLAATGGPPAVGGP